MNNKIALVTGASRGIGKAVAEKLSDENYTVIINFKNSAEKAEEVRRAVITRGGNAEIFRADVSNEKEAEDLVSFCVGKFGRLDLCVNNAGISEWGLFTDMSEKTINNVIANDLSSVMFVSKAAARQMVKQKNGSIINISSMWGEVGASCEVVYSAAKAGVIGFTKALAKEVAPSGIRVNCVSPGVIDTDMLSRFSADEIESLIDDIPLGRIGKPSDVAEAVAFLASGKADYITGQILSVNGGLVV